MLFSYHTSNFVGFTADIRPCGHWGNNNNNNNGGLGCLTGKHWPVDLIHRHAQNVQILNVDIHCIYIIFFNCHLMLVCTILSDR